MYPHRVHPTRCRAHGTLYRVYQSVRKLIFLLRYDFDDVHFDVTSMKHWSAYSDHYFILVINLYPIVDYINLPTIYSNLTVIYYQYVWWWITMIILVVHLLPYTQWMFQAVRWRGTIRQLYSLCTIYGILKWWYGYSFSDWWIVVL